MSGRLSEAAAVTLSESPATEDSPSGRFLSARTVEPEAVMPFVQTADGEFFTLLRYDLTAAPAARLHFRSFQLPEGARIYVYSTGNDGVVHRVAGPYTGSGTLREGEFWADAVPGGTIIVELQVSREIPSTLPFQVDSIELLTEVLPPAEVAPPPEPATRVSLFRGQAVEHEVYEGVGVLEGDILLGSVDELPPANPSQSKSSSKSAIAITATRYRWPNGVIPYVVDPSVVNKTWVSQAISHWNVKLAGVISFVPRTSQVDYVHFVNASGCSSYIGRIGGAQQIRLSSACSAGNIIHEIGHAVGLFHEQSREDRNSWIKVILANVISSAVPNFYQAIYTSDDLIYYGYNSIMHYTATSFSANGKPTLETIPAGIPIGQRTALDISDIAAVRQMYNKPSSVTQISSVPTGLVIHVDGAAVTTPAAFNWSPGSVHTISAPASVPGYGFVRWTDGGARTHSIVAAVTGRTIAATYAYGYVSASTSQPVTTAPAQPAPTLLTLTASAAPSTTGTVSKSPSASSYAYGTTVRLTATPAAGYCFSSWTGLVAGTPPETSVSMTKAYTLAANFITGSVTPATTFVSTGKSGGTFTMNTRATTGCSWGIKSNTSWITVSKSSATSTAPSFTYTIQPNNSGTYRSGTVTVGDDTIIVNQSMF